jgi:hypothetical protein
MKKLAAFSLTIIFSINFLMSQVPSLIWANSQGGTSYDSGKSIVVDNLGNSYTAGIFSGTADLDPSSNTMNFTSEGSYDGFVSKLDVNGQLVWAFSLGSTSADEVNSITIDGNGDIIVAGSFQGLVDFDPSGNTFQVGAVSSADVFVAKYTPNGDLIWAKQMGGNSADIAFDVETDSQGNVYTTGHFYATADFDPDNVGTANLTSNGQMDVFVSKLDVNGDFLWVKQIGGASEETGTSISIDGSGDVIVGGNFWGTVDFDPDGTTNNVTSNGGSDAFGLKLNNNGAYLNVVKLGGAGNEYCLAVDSDGTNNIYLGGQFSGTMDINPLGTANNITSNGGNDIFMSKYDQNFQLDWGYGFGDVDDDAARGIKVDANSNVYLTGYMRGTVDFDPGASTDSYTSNGSNDIFLLKVDALGAYQWSSTFGSATNDSGYEIGVWNSNVFVVGDYSGTVDFDPSPNNSDLVSAGSQDIFTLALGCLTTTGTDVQTSCDTYTWIDGNTYTSDNNTATHTLTNAAGCDSIVTLDLTILNSTTGTDVQTACDTYTWIDGNTYTSDNNTATHTLTNAAGCDSLVTLDLTINTVDVSTTNQSPELSVNQSGASYQWLDCDDNFNVLNGETDQTFNAVMYGNGNYAVVVTINGCTDTSECMVVDNLGINKEGISAITFYPNPTHGNLTLELGSFQDEIKVVIYDALGSVMMRNTYHNTDVIKLKLEETQGVYLVEVNSSFGSEVFRVIRK